MSATILPDRFGAALGGERSGCRRQSRQAVAAKLERLHELVLGAGDVIGCVEALDSLQQRLGGAAVGGDLSLELELLEPLLGLDQTGEELGRELVRLGDDRVEVGEVVLEASLRAR